ncbi:olfactory receptor 1500-like [Gastrophryne carolinensis]
MQERWQYTDARSCNSKAPSQLSSISNLTILKLLLNSVKESKVMNSPKENISTSNTNFILVGLVELEDFSYLYAILVLALYSTIMFVSSTIVYVTWIEETLHKPMYIFIGNFVFNVMYGSSNYLPKLVVDLFSKRSTISLSSCLSQAFFTQSYFSVEIFTFMVMAYDRYLAVGYPLRYPTLMTNVTVKKIILAIWTYVVVCISLVVWLAARLTFCGVNINNVYCETMSLLRLACSDISINNIYGTTYTLSMTISCILVVLYCYIRTAVICLKHTVDAAHKAAHTLVTHAIAFSIFMAGTMFVTFRYRLYSGSISVAAHIAISMTGITTSVTLNPLIYGIRTEALRRRIVHHMKKIMQLTKSNS